MIIDRNFTGCANCQVTKCATSHYRGGQCSLLRYNIGADFDPQTNAERILVAQADEIQEVLARGVKKCLDRDDAWDDAKTEEFVNRFVKWLANPAVFQ